MKIHSTLNSYGLAGLFAVCLLFHPVAASSEPAGNEVLLAMSFFKKDDSAPPPLKSTPATSTAKPAGTSTNVPPATANPQVPMPVASMEGTSTTPSAQTATAESSASTGTAVILPGVQSVKPSSSLAGTSASATPVANDNSTISAQVAPATKEEPPPAEEYSYDPKSRRDPFQSMIKLIKVDQSRRDLPPLQRVEITDMKLVGIISGGYGYYALIQTPDGKGYTVRDGTLMGTNNGVIKSITEKRIIISEPSIDVNGKKTTREVELLQRLKEVNE